LANITGKSAEDFANAWKQDAVGGFVEFVESIGSAGDEATTLLQSFMGENVRATRAFLSVANAGDLLRKSIDKSNIAWEENIALTVEANKRFQTTESQLEMAKSGFNNMKDAIGDALVPVLLDLVETMKPVIQNLTEWIRENPKLTKNILLGVTAFAGLVAVLGTVGLAMIAVSGAISGLIGLAGLLGSAIAILASPIGLIIGAIALWVIKWDEIKGGMEVVKDGMISLGKAIMDKLSPALTFLRQTIAVVIYGYVLLWEHIQNFINIMAEKLSPVIEFVTSILDAMGSVAKLVANIVGDYFSGKIALAMLAFDKFKIGMGWLKDGLTEVGNHIKSFFAPIVDSITDKVEKFVGWLKDAWNWIKKIADKADEVVFGGGSKSSGDRKANGGFVKAPIGQGVPTILHGGEYVVPHSEVIRGQMPGRSVQVNIHGGNFANEYQAREITTQMVEDLRTQLRF
jgi:hypothetical protein